MDETKMSILNQFVSKNQLEILNSGLDGEEGSYFEELMAKLTKKGVQISEIFDDLEAQGYRTITGRKWTEANIRNTISRLKE